jgi:transposase
MAIKRHKPEEIVTKLRQVEVLVGQGVARIDAIREVQITEQTFYRWRKQYGGMGTAQLRELKRLQKENERLRGAVSVPSLANIYRHNDVDHGAVQTKNSL